VQTAPSPEQLQSPEFESFVSSFPSPTGSSGGQGHVGHACVDPGPADEPSLELDDEENGIRETFLPRRRIIKEKNARYIQ
jgi:hypothetical protein